MGRNPVNAGAGASMKIWLVSTTRGTGSPLTRRSVLGRMVISGATDAAVKVSVKSTIDPDTAMRETGVNDTLSSSGQSELSETMTVTVRTAARTAGAN
jgi:hypothetical protein